MYCLVAYTNSKDDLPEYKCLYCKKHFQKKFDENVSKRFANTCEFSNYYTNKFYFVTAEGVHSYEYIDYWGEFNEASLLKTEDFYRSVCKRFRNIEFR